MLYSKNGGYPALLPNRIILSSGVTRTDKSSFTAEELADAGYVAVDNPPEVLYPNKLEWDGTDWYVREPNPVEVQTQWRYIQARCTRLLQDTDYKVIKAVELGVPLDPAITQYRQELRDIYNNVNNIDPWTVAWPSISYEE